MQLCTGRTDNGSRHRLVKNRHADRVVTGKIRDHRSPIDSETVLVIGFVR